MKIELTEEQKEIIKNGMSHFEPLNEEEQKLLLFMCLQIICELGNKKPKNAIIRNEMSNYTTIANLFTKREGINTKAFLLHNVVKKYYDKFFEKVEVH